MSEESIPDERERKNVSELARGYHVATAYAILVDGFLSEEDLSAEKRALS